MERIKLDDNLQERWKPISSSWIPRQMLCFLPRTFFLFPVGSVLLLGLLCISYFLTRFLSVFTGHITFSYRRFCAVGGCYCSFLNIACWKQRGMTLHSIMDMSAIFCLLQVLITNEGRKQKNALFFHLMHL